MFEILSLLPGNKRKTSNGWWSFNAVCCHHRGHRADTRKRGGVSYTTDTDWTYHCFNCGFSCKFTRGNKFSYKLKQLLGWLGADETEIEKWNFESIKLRGLIDRTSPIKHKISIRFDSVELPVGELLDEKIPSHHKFIEYLKSRGLSYKDYPYMVTPNAEGRNSNRIIIPYTFNGRITGYISRYLDDRIPKYIKNQQTGYVFGIDLQKPTWETCIVTEGVFDALSINGCALTHDDISDEQAQLLKALRKRIIVVPDLDETGLAICDRALDLGFQVSIPSWKEGIKDVNDAVVEYGKLPTLLSILQAATTSKIKVNMRRRKIDKRL